MDVDPAEIGKNQNTQLAVIGDVRVNLRVMVKLLLQKAIKKTEETPWFKHVQETKNLLERKFKTPSG